MRIFIILVLAIFSFACSNKISDKPMSDHVVSNLQALASQNNFSSVPGTLYNGVHNPILRREMNEKFDIAVSEFIKAHNNGASKSIYLELLKTQISKFDRLTLDTEDAEQVASNFEKIMDCINLESSEGILNEWMYGS